MIGFLADLLITIFGDIICTLIGEIVLFVVTLGRHQRQFDADAARGASFWRGQGFLILLIGVGVVFAVSTGFLKL